MLRPCLCHCVSRVILISSVALYVVTASLAQDAAALLHETATKPAIDSLGDPLPPGARLRLGTTRFSPPSNVRGLALSPDESTVVTYCRNLIAWDTRTGKERWRASQTELSSAMTSYGHRPLAFSSDSSRFYTPGRNRFHVWNTLSGEHEIIAVKSPIAQPQSQSTAMTIDVTRDGRKIALGDSVGVQLCDHLGNVIVEIANSVVGPHKHDNNDRLAFNGASSYGRFSPDGRILAIGTSDRPNEIRLHDTTSGDEIQNIALTSRMVRLDFSPDGKQLVATERDKAVRLYDLESGRCLWSYVAALNNPFENYTSDVAFSPDGQVIAAGATDLKIYLLDPKSGQETGQLTGHHWYPWCLAFTSDSKTLYSSGWDRMIRRWDVVGRKQLPPPQGIHASSMVTISSDGRLVAYADDRNTIRIADAQSGLERRTLEVAGMQFSQLVFSPDGRLIAAGGDAGNNVQVVIWNAENGEQRNLWNWPKGRDPHSQVEALSFSADGRRLAAAVFRQDRAYLWDLSTGQQSAELPHQRIYGLSFSPDGTTLATVGWDSIIRLWDTDNWENVVEINAEDQRIPGGNQDLRMYGVRFSPDGSLIATAHMNAFARIWSTDGMVLRSEFSTKGSTYGAMDFSPDGLWLATGVAGGNVDLWDPFTATRVRTIGTHQSTVYTLGFGRDSRTIVSGSEDGLCYVWDSRPAAGDAAADLEPLWNDLAGDDVIAAYKAMCALPESPDRAVAMLTRKLQSVRSVAHPETLPSGAITEESERRVRMMKLLVKKDPKFEQAITVRRAISVLGQIGTPEATQLLEDLAQRDPNGEVARYANRELARQNAR